MKHRKLLFGFVAIAFMAGAQDRRSMCVFLDLRSMTAEQQLHAREVALNFVETKLAPSDQVTVMTFTSKVNVVQDFSSDHGVLLAALRKIVPTPVSSLDEVSNVSSKLLAMRDAFTILEAVPGKKQMMYFAGGDPPDAVEARDQVQAAVNAAIRANVAIYSIDMRQ